MLTRLPLASMAMQPIVIAALTAITLMGPEPISWLDQLLERKYSRYRQKPEFFWTFKKIVNRAGVSDLRLLAMRTTGAATLKMPGVGEVRVSDVLADPELAANHLSQLCVSIFDGKGGTPLRSIARRLDMAAYGGAIQERAQDIWAEIRAAK